MASGFEFQTPQIGAVALKSTKSIVNAHSTSGFTGVVNQISSTEVTRTVKTTSLGAVTANILKSALSVSGSGQIDLLFTINGDATSRTHRIKVTIDGLVVFDSTSAAINAAPSGTSIIGTIPSATGIPVVFQPTYFNTSLLVEVASSLTETSTIVIGYNYRTF